MAFYLFVIYRLNSLIFFCWHFLYPWHDSNMNWLNVKSWKILKFSVTVRTAFKVGSCFLTHKKRKGEIMKSFKKSAFCLVLSSLFVLCSWTAVSAAPKGTVTIAIPADLSLDFFNSKSANGRMGLGQIYQTLGTYNPSGTDRVPQLANPGSWGKKGCHLRSIWTSEPVLRMGIRWPAMTSNSAGSSLPPEPAHIGVTPD